MQPIIDSLPNDWQIVIWDNGERMVTRSDGFAEVCHDLSVFGRYAAIEYATNDFIYVQDDDVIVSDPQAIADTFVHTRDICAVCREGMAREVTGSGHVVWACANRHCVLDEVVCNQPQEFRHEFYSDHSLVGFGAAFHRNAPVRAFERFAVGAWDVTAPEIDGEDIHYVWEYGDNVNSHPDDRGMFNRTCDIVFTGLTPCVRVDVQKENLPHAYAEDRMWRQPNHQAERQRMLDLVRRVRDGE